MKAPSAKVILGCLVIGLVCFAVLSYFEKQRLESQAEYNSVMLALINNKCIFCSFVVFMFLALNSYYNSIESKPKSIRYTGEQPVVDTMTAPPPQPGVTPAPEQAAASL